MKWWCVVINTHPNIIDNHFHLVEKRTAAFHEIILRVLLPQVSLLKDTIYLTVKERKKSTKRKKENIIIYLY
jgi:hypothetical protein